MDKDRRQKLYIKDFETYSYCKLTVKRYSNLMAQFFFKEKGCELV